MANKIKRFLSMALTVFMIMTMMPATVLATEDPTTPITNEIPNEAPDEIPGEGEGQPMLLSEEDTGDGSGDEPDGAIDTWEKFTDALEIAVNGTTIELAGDLNAGTDCSIQIPNGVKIYGNGNRITVEHCPNLDCSLFVCDGGIYVENLTVEVLSSRHNVFKMVNGGTLYNVTINGNFAYGVIVDSSVVKIDKCTFSDGDCGIYNEHGIAAHEFTDNIFNSSRAALLHGSETFTGNKVKGADGLSVNTENAIIEDNIFSGERAMSISASTARISGNNTLTGDTYIDLKNHTLIIENDAALNVADKLTIKNPGTIQGKIILSSANAEVIASEGPDLVVETDVPGYKVEYKDNSYQLVSDDGINTWEEFVEALNAGVTNIVLTGDLTTDSAHDVRIPNGVTIDGKGHSITVGSVPHHEYNALFYTAGSDVRVENLTVNANAKPTYGHAFALQKGGTLSNVTIANAFNGVYVGNTAVNITGCTFNDVAWGIYTEDSSAEHVYRGNTFNGSSAARLCSQETFTNNIVNSDAGLTVATSNATITGNTFSSDVDVALNITVDATIDFSSNNISAGNIVLENNSTLTIKEGTALRISDERTITGEGNVLGTIVLTNKNAKLNAPKELTANVTADIPGYTVEYKNGTYKLVKNAATYTVTFDPNGGEGVRTTQTFTEGETKALNENKFTRKNFYFTGWKDDEGNFYTNKQAVKFDKNTTLYAQWARVPSTTSYTVQYNANGGTGSVYLQAFTSSMTFQLRMNEFVREGYKFVGWNTKADGTGDSYAEGASFSGSIKKSIVLYAQWKLDVPEFPAVRPEYKIEVEGQEGKITRTNDTSIVYDEMYIRWSIGFETGNTTFAMIAMLDVTWVEGQEGIVGTFTIPVIETNGIISGVCYMVTTDDRANELTVGEAAENIYGILIV